MTPPTHPGDRPSPRTFLTVLAVTGALSALVVCAAVAAAPDSVRAPLAWGAGTAAVVLSAAVATATHALRTTRGVRRRLESVTRDLGRLLQQQARTTEESRLEQQRLIDELARQRIEFSESFAADRARLEQESGAETERIRKENARLTVELEQARRERATAISATSNAAARMQALATATLADLRAMEDRHSDEDVLADLLHLDHRTAQAGRLADSIAVLTGARSGRRWARPIGMESILRGAMGRIAGYRRVRVHSVSETAVAGHAAEGVMHALAELLDNAANFSPPTAEVHVYVEEVPSGVIVSVEDSGLVMGDVQLRRAERAVCGDVSELGGLTGTRLGLAVVGRLARKHGLKVSFRPSARGGTGVLMLIPQDVLTGPAPAAATPLPETAGPAAAPAGVETVRVHETAAPAEEGPAGLPKRRRGRTLAEAERSRSAPRSGAPQPASADGGGTRATRFSSFRRAVRPASEDSGRPTADPAVPTAAAPQTGDPDEATPAGAHPTHAPGSSEVAGPDGGGRRRQGRASDEGAAGGRQSAAPGTSDADGRQSPAHDGRAAAAPEATARDLGDASRVAASDDGAAPSPTAAARGNTAHPADRTPPDGARGGHAAGAARDASTACRDAVAGPRSGDGGAPDAPGGSAPDGASDDRAGARQDLPGEPASPSPSHPHAHPEGDTTS